jgi:hypothetical protein
MPDKVVFAHNAINWLGVNLNTHYQEYPMPNDCTLPFKLVAQCIYFSLKERKLYEKKRKSRVCVLYAEEY